MITTRDLKPENVVFFEKLGMVKLTDFGFSNKFNPGQVNNLTLVISDNQPYE